MRGIQRHSVVLFDHDHSFMQRNLGNVQYTHSFNIQ